MSSSNYLNLGCRRRQWRGPRRSALPVVCSSYACDRCAAVIDRLRTICLDRSVCVRPYARSAGERHVCGASAPPREPCVCERGTLLTAEGSRWSVYRADGAKRSPGRRARRVIRRRTRTTTTTSTRVAREWGVRVVVVIDYSNNPARRSSRSRRRMMQGRRRRYRLDNTYTRRRRQFFVSATRTYVPRVSVDRVGRGGGGWRVNMGEEGWSKRMSIDGEYTRRRLTCTSFHPLWFLFISFVRFTPPPLPLLLRRSGGGTDRGRGQQPARDNDENHTNVVMITTTTATTAVYTTCAVVAAVLS